MECGCKKDLEAKLTERFVSVSPDATEHQVKLEGYGLALVGNTIKVMPCTTAVGTALFPNKKGGSKLKTVKQTMAFSFCPFCGVKLDSFVEEAA